MAVPNKIIPGINCFKDCFTDDLDGSYEQNSYYIDKTRFIEKLWNFDSKISLFTRPRRFGKSMFLTMLESFFAPNPKDPTDLTLHKKIFSQLEIFKNKEFCQKFMGKLPSIYISFATAGADISLHESLSGIARIVRECAKRYEFLQSSENLSEDDKNLIRNLCNLTDLKLTDEELSTKLQESLRDISDLLNKHYGKKVLILVDEYDVPLAYASNTDYYQNIKLVMTHMLESALKKNENLSRGVVTGCLRVAKESIFTGWNNFTTVDYDNTEFSTLFGFTTSEVKLLLKTFNFEDRFDTFKDWYDGYLFADDEIYCPWDVVNYTKDLLKNPKAKPITYWNNTASNRLAMLAFAKNPKYYAEQFKLLLNGDSIKVKYFDSMNYNMIKLSDNSHPYLWSILYMTGYLTKDPDQNGCEDKYVKLRIPNRCVKECLQDQIDWSFSKSNPTYLNSALSIFDCFKKDDADLLQDKLQETLQAYVSIYDTQKGTDKESLYHAFLNGPLSAVVAPESDYYSSNGEIGSGRADIQFVLNKSENSRDRKLIIIECKVAVSERELEKQSDLALEQIKEKYIQGVKGKYKTVTDICIYGISFYKKQCFVKSETISL
jgi:hypothetical protein